MIDNNNSDNNSDNNNMHRTLEHVLAVFQKVGFEGRCGVCQNTQAELCTHKWKMNGK